MQALSAHPAGARPARYPSLRLIGRLAVPLLVLHGERDEIAPLMHAEALAEAAPGPNRIHVFAGAGHNDLLARAGPEWLRAIAASARELGLERLARQ